MDSQWNNSTAIKTTTMASYNSYLNLHFHKTTSHSWTHDLWILLQDMISEVFMIITVNINMRPIPSGYGVTGVFNCHKSPPVNHTLPVILHGLELAERGSVNGRYNLQLTLFTVKWQGELCLAVVI